MFDSKISNDKRKKKVNLWSHKLIKTCKFNLSKNVFQKYFVCNNFLF